MTGNGVGRGPLPPQVKNDLFFIFWIIQSMNFNILKCEGMSKKKKAKSQGAESVFFQNKTTNPHDILWFISQSKIQVNDFA